MRFATILVEQKEQAAVRVHGSSWAPLHHVDDALGGDLLKLIGQELGDDQLDSVLQQANRLATKFLVGVDEAVYRPPFRRPRKIWGIGLNYLAHAADLEADYPDQPASFIKGDHTIVGPGDSIVLPRQSQRVTAEAELGVIIGRYTRNVSETEALGYVFGFCPILDQTAEDILQQNARYLTRAKNFPTFFSFGPEVLTPDELITDQRALDQVVVKTLINGAVVRANSIGNMAHSPSRLISFHSDVMPLFPGDVISTGTPGAGVIAAGDSVEAELDGFRKLINPVSSEAPSQ